MTAPAAAFTKKGLGRHYRSPSNPDIEGPSVTNVIGIKEKPAIAWWQTKGALRAAWEDRAAFSRMQDVEVAIKAYQSAAFGSRDKAADLGTDVHAVCEALAGDGPIPAYTDAAAPFVEQFMDAVERLALAPVEVERSLWSDLLAYGGTFDLVANIDGVRTLLDIKTGKGVYDEAAWQLAALNGCDVYADDGELWVPADRLMVLHLRPDAWAAHEVTDEVSAFVTFAGLRKAWDGVRGPSALKKVA